MMNTHLNIFGKTMGLLCLLVILVSCQDTMPRRSTITQGANTGDELVCPEGQEVSEETDETTGEVTKVCKTPPLVRPTNAVFWKPNFCACKDSTPVTFGSGCASKCAGKNTEGIEKLFADFTVTEDISLGGLGNMDAWCNLILPGASQNPGCELQAKDAQGNIISLEVSVPPNTNSLTADLSDIAYDKTYVFTLVEKTSGAKSNSVQMIKFSSDISLPTLGPLKVSPISQYTCMVRDYSEDTVTGDIYYDSAYRLHFYFTPNLPPNPIPAGNANLICHDIFNPLYGLADSELYPRFERIPGVFNLWDKTNEPRLWDNNENGQLDINEAIIQKTRNLGGTIANGVNFFQKFSWPGSPQLQNESGNTSSQELGFFMAPWIDQTTFKSYCLGNTHYESNNPLFQAMRDYLGVETEGLYIGMKNPETVVDSSGNLATGYSDYILIRETDLKAVWFVLNAQGTPIAANDTNISGGAIYFYYPLNKQSPFVRTSTQRIYRLKSASELQNTSNSTNGSTPTGGATTFPPHDKKIGCVPKF